MERTPICRDGRQSAPCPEGGCPIAGLPLTRKTASPSYRLATLAGLIVPQAAITGIPSPSSSGSPPEATDWPQHSSGPCRFAPALGA